MGSKDEYILLSRAASILGWPQDKLQDIISQGIVNWKIEGDSIYVNQADVADIHRLNIAGVMKPGELIRRLLFLERKVDRLELTMDMMLESSGLSASRFRMMTDKELQDLYDNAVGMLAEDKWTKDEMTPFCEVFVKISEVEIDRLNAIISLDHSWQTFYELCIRMTRHVASHPQLGNSLDLQRIRDLLSAGRKNLSTIAVLFVDKVAQVGPTRTLLERLAVSDLEAFDALARKIGKKTPKSLI